jgi:hypothetical protein
MVPLRRMGGGAGRWSFVLAVTRISYRNNVIPEEVKVVSLLRTRELIYQLNNHKHVV